MTASLITTTSKEFVRTLNLRVTQRGKKEQEMPDVNIFAVLAAAVSTFVVGGLWYSPVMFYRPWMRLNGFTEESLKGGNAALIYGGSLLLQVVAAWVLAMFVAGGSFAFAVGASLSVGVAWVATSFGTMYLFERRSIALWAINSGYHVVAFGIIGLILGLWR